MTPSPPAAARPQSAALPGAAVATVGGLVGRGLALIGVEATYGRPLAGLDVAVAADPAVAGLLAEAHLLVHRSRCAVHAGDGTLTVLDRRAALTPGVLPLRPAPAGVTAPAPLVVEDIGGLVDCWPALAERLAADGVAAFRLALDPAAPAPGLRLTRPEAVDRWVAPGPDAVAHLDAARAPAVLVGPGVAEPSLVPGLHALAAAGGFGVLNTWGAKGVFDWRSRHHLATVGLQDEDLDRGGLAGADLLVAAGLDPREVPGGGWDGCPVVTLAPGSLGPAAEALAPGRGRAVPEVPPLRPDLARVTQEGWTAVAGPLPPSRVTLAYSRALGAGGLVAADPGTAGFWVARTFPTTALGGAVVPARAGAHGLAAACVAVARRARPGRPALAVVDAGDAPDAGGAGGVGAPAGRDPAEATAAVVEAAARWGVAVPVERWAPDGPGLGAEQHAARLDDLLAAGVAAGAPARVAAADLRTDGRQMAHMVEVAGPVVAWTYEPAAAGPAEGEGSR